MIASLAGESPSARTVVRGEPCADPRLEWETSPEPLLTVAIPCRNEERHIAGCLASIQAQDYPPERVEILIADGRSTDATLAILAQLRQVDPRIRVVDNPERLQSAGLNRLIREARGEIVVRMDAHCDYDPGYLRACVSVLRRTQADIVGGAQRVRARTLFQKALRVALDSPLGVGGAAYRSADREGFVDTVFLGAFRREVFERVGLYDPRAVTNEDAELNQRLLAAGGKIYLSKEIVVHYEPRASYRELFRQYFRYGSGRARTLLKHRRLPSLRPVLPFAAVSGGALLALAAPFQPFAPLSLFAFLGYLGLCAAEAVRVERRAARRPHAGRAGWRALPVIFAIFPTLHLAHGLGFGRGLVRYASRPDW
jgi:glycosyltransferase involved in cell wall biosynthesis